MKLLRRVARATVVFPVVLLAAGLAAVQLWAALDGMTRLTGWEALPSALALLIVTMIPEVGLLFLFLLSIYGFHSSVEMDWITSVVLAAPTALVFMGMKLTSISARAVVDRLLGREDQ